jgi:hypothetical protein
MHDTTRSWYEPPTLTGRHEFELDPRDPLGTGFLLR